MNRQELLKKKVHEVLVSKAEEMHMLGYDAVTVDEIWDCVNSKYGNEWPRLHTVVNDIFSLRPMTFMNWMTVGAFTGKIDMGKNGLL